MSELPSFIELLYDLIHKLENENNALKADAGDDDSKPQLLKEKLLAIRSSCAIYNKKAAKNLLTELKEKTWPPSAAQLLSNISEYLLHSEFDEIVKSIDDFVKQN